MGQLDPAVEQQLANLNNAEWSALAARVRAPDGVEGLRAAAAQHLSGAQLNAFVAAADVSKFTNDAGEIDAGKVTQHIAGLYKTPAPGGQRSSEWGRRDGTGGREAAAARHGVMGKPEPDAVRPDNSPGAGGRAAAQQRHQTTWKDDD